VKVEGWGWPKHTHTQTGGVVCRKTCHNNSKMSLAHTSKYFSEISTRSQKPSPSNNNTRMLRFACNVPANCASSGLAAAALRGRCRCAPLSSPRQQKPSACHATRRRRLRSLQRVLAASPARVQLQPLSAARRRTQGKRFGEPSPSR